MQYFEPDEFMSKLQPHSCEERWREGDARAKESGGKQADWFEATFPPTEGKFNMRLNGQFP